jgi:hypothetical protein
MKTFFTALCTRWVVISRCPLQQGRSSRTTEVPSPVEIDSIGEQLKQKSWSTNQMRILDIIDDTDIIEFNVEILVDALESTTNLDVVLELDCDLMVDKRLEEAEHAVSKGLNNAADSQAGAVRSRDKLHIREDNQDSQLLIVLPD